MQFPCSTERPYDRDTLVSTYPPVLLNCPCFDYPMIKCNVWQCTAHLLQSTLSRHYSFVLTFWTRSSWVIWFAINEYCCLSKPLFHWIHSQSTLIYFRWKWKWRVRSGCRSKTGIFSGLFVLSTNVWTGGYFVFKSFQHLSRVKFVDHQMRNQGLNVSLQLPG